MDEVVWMRTTTDRVLSRIKSALDELGAMLDPVELDRAAMILRHAPNVCVTGMGKSGHVARKVAATMSSLGRRAYFVHPAEALHGDLGMIGPEDAVLAFSHSGETLELRGIMLHVDPSRIIAVTSKPNSTLAQHAGTLLQTPSAPETCPNGQAPTTSTTMQIVVGDLLAIIVATQQGRTAQDFKKLHPGGSLGR